MKLSLPMIASLPMYDLPEIGEVTQAWWAGLCKWWHRLGLKDVPSVLNGSDDPYDDWLSPSLFLSQTCGYPLTHRLRGKVTLVAAPCYKAEGCEEGSYRSALIVREGVGLSSLADLRGRKAAVNSYDSQSGWNALRYALREFGKIADFFASIDITGSHRLSLAAIRERKADIAAIDCVTFALIKRYAPAEVSGLSVLAWSAPAPSLPLITRAGIDLSELSILREGLSQACADPSLASCHDRLLLKTFAFPPLSAYDAILMQEKTACERAI